MMEIQEVRAVLEGYIVKKAVENITEEQIARLQEGIDRMAQVMAEGGNGSIQESDFHKGLAEATGNSALKSIYMLCEELLSSAQHNAWRVARAIGARITAVEEHQAILDAIRSRDKNRAEMLIQAHMDYACENLRRMYEQEKTE